MDDEEVWEKRGEVEVDEEESGEVEKDKWDSRPLDFIVLNNELPSDTRKLPERCSCLLSFLLNTPRKLPDRCIAPLSDGLLPVAKTALSNGRVD